ncbi:hypothetical protein BLOT_011302, partial [Blomia tropicalis]
MFLFIMLLPFSFLFGGLGGICCPPINPQMQIALEHIVLFLQRFHSLNGWFKVLTIFKIITHCYGSNLSKLAILIMKHVLNMAQNHVVAIMLFPRREYFLGKGSTVEQSMNDPASLCLSAVCMLLETCSRMGLKNIYHITMVELNQYHINFELSILTPDFVPMFHCHIDLPKLSFLVFVLM